MIGFDSHTRAYLVLGATEMHKQIGGFADVMEDALEPDPQSTHLSEFCNRAPAYSAMPAAGPMRGGRQVDAANRRTNTAVTHQMVAQIGRVYPVERAIRDADSQERRRVLQEKSAPIFRTIKARLDEKREKDLAHRPYR